MSENRSRRVVAEIRFGEGRSPVAKVAGRSIHQYWTLLASHFRDVLLPPQRRSDDGGVSWTWKEPAEARPATTADLDRVRKRLQTGLESFVDSPGNPGVGAEGHGGLEAQTIVEQLTVRVSGLVQRFVAMADDELVQFVCRTDTGAMIHSWGLDKPASLTYPDATESEINGAIFAGRYTPAGHDVVLENANGLRMARVTSDSDGGFRFRRLRPGRYRVRVLSDRVKFPPQGVAVTLERGAAFSVELRSEDDPAQEEVGTAAVSPKTSAAKDEELGRPRSRPRLLAAVVVLALLLAGGYAGFRWLRRPAESAPESVRQSRMTPERYDPAGSAVSPSSGLSMQGGTPALGLRGTRRGPPVEPMRVEPPAEPVILPGDQALFTAPRGPSPSPAEAFDSAGHAGPAADAGTAGDDRSSAPGATDRGLAPRAGAAAPPGRRPSTGRSPLGVSRGDAPTQIEQGAPQAGDDAVDASLRAPGTPQSEPLAASTPGASQTTTRREIVNTTKVQTATAPEEPPLAAVQNEPPADVSAEKLPISTPAAGIRKPGSILLRDGGKGKGSAPPPVLAANNNEGSLPEMPRGTSEETSTSSMDGGAAAARPQSRSAANAGLRSGAPATSTSTATPPERGVDKSTPDDAPVLPAKGTSRAAKPASPLPVPKPAPTSIPRLNETRTRLEQEQHTPSSIKGEEAGGSQVGTPSASEPDGASTGSAANAAEAALGASHAGSTTEPSGVTGRRSPSPGSNPATAARSRDAEAMPDANRATALLPADVAADLPEFEFQGSFVLSGWSAKIAKDMIVPTQPLPAGDRDTTEELRQQLLVGERSRLPETFRSPEIHCELLLALPERLAGERLVWKAHGGAGAPGVTLSFADAVASVNWRVGAPPGNIQATLVRADGSTVVEIVFDPMGRCAFRGVGGVSASATVSVSIAPEDRRGSEPRFVWSGAEAAEAGPDLATVRIPLAAGERSEAALVLCDRESGWVLASKLMPNHAD